MSTDAHDQTRPTVRRRLRLLLVFAAIAAAAVVLAACGSSGSSSTGTASSSTASAKATPGGASGAGGGRFASLRTCMQKEGINLPAPKGTPGQPPGGAPGQPPGGAGGAGGGGRAGGFLKAPEGVSQAKFQEALKKCGAGSLRRGGSNLSSSTARAALSSYATCMRENGVNLPAPNTSGQGPVFNTSGVNTSSASFKSAQKKCQSHLSGAFGGNGNSGNGGAPGGQPAA
jgi:hypothetical protein